MTETTEVLAPEAVAPVAETQNPATDAQQAEVAQPEEGQEPAKELTPAEKEARALKRRVDRLTRERYQERAQFDVERQQWQQRPQEQTAPQEAPTGLANQDVIEARAREIAAAQVFNTKCNDIVARGKKELGEDFDRSVAALNEEGVLFGRDTKPTALLQAVIESDMPDKLLHHLGQNPDLAAELADMTPVRQAKRLGQLEAELAPKAREPSRAPRPLEPVKAVATPGIPNPDTDPAAWRAWRDKTAKR